jgi:uncharacterized protein
MTSRASVEEFLAQKTLAVVGVSRNSRKFGRSIYRELKAKGHRVFPVNPNAYRVDDDVCYPDVESIPEPVDGVVLVVPPDQAEKAVESMVKKGIRRVWMQPGSESYKAIARCRENQIQVISGECILMFAEPAALIHRVHRCIKRLLGRLPG